MYQSAQASFDYRGFLKLSAQDMRTDPKSGSCSTSLSWVFILFWHLREVKLSVRIWQQMDARSFFSAPIHPNHNHNHNHNQNHIQPIQNQHASTSTSSYLQTNLSSDQPWDLHPNVTPQSPSPPHLAPIPSRPTSAGKAPSYVCLFRHSPRLLDALTYSQHTPKSLTRVNRQVDGR